MRPSERGFTLVEVMIALVIFALIGLAGIALVNSVIGVEERSKGRLDRTAELQRMMYVLTRDLQQSVPKSIALESDLLSFRRNPNSLDDPADLIGYRLNDDRFLRILNGGAPAGGEQTLLTGASSVEWSFYFPDLGWRSELPVAEAGDEAVLGGPPRGPSPTAIAVEIQLDRSAAPPSGSLRRVVELAETPEPERIW